MNIGETLRPLSIYVALKKWIDIKNVHIYLTVDGK